MIRYISVPGTHGIGRTQDWDAYTSPFNRFLKSCDIEPWAVSPLKRYMWSTALDGIDSNNYTWDAAGRALAHYIVPPLMETSLIAPEDTYIIAHSHGGNVVAYACGIYGLKVSGLITVGMPIRKDMKVIYEKAAPNIARHLHLYAGWKDFWQVLGSVFDGRFGVHRKHPYARNERVPGGHGSILRDEELFPILHEKGWLDFFKGIPLSPPEPAVAPEEKPVAASTIPDKPGPENPEVVLNPDNQSPT